jgi:hypothetical protein
MATTITKTMTMMTTRPLLYIAQKGCFKIFKYEKQGETLEFFFRALTSSIVDSIAIALLECTILWPDPCVHQNDASDISDLLLASLTPSVRTLD